MIIEFIRKNKKSWLPIILCIYAFLKEIKVGEPFVFKYQTTVLNFTGSVLSGQVYPLSAYSYLIFLVPIFLLTDIFLYKPTMIIEMIGQVTLRYLFIYGLSLFEQQIAYIFYGIASASEIAFFAYIYAILDKEQYQKLTTWTRAATMGGRTTGYIVAQLIILAGIGDYLTLNKIALVFPTIVLFICIFLPRVHWKHMVIRLFETNDNCIEMIKNEEKPDCYSKYLIFRFKQLKNDFVKIYSVGYIRKWSFWWAMTTCMSLQVALYAQTLWGEASEKNNPLNGFAEAAYTFTAAFSILLMNNLNINWDKYGEIVLVIISTIDGGLLFINAITSNIFVMYGCYIGYRSFYQVMITIAQWNIAKKMMCESYGLVFGVNSFIALVMQSIIAGVISDKRGLGMDVRSQYIVYCGCHLLIAIIFLCSVINTLISNNLSNSKITSSISKQFSNCDLSSHTESDVV
ncbi:Reduced folate carrier family and Major facilitator superfamily domain, general substrate transporter-containing protein [Strongyloides ratti]|uniref:Reduced folate carrier family and Major facilitator superfamily domain, general substrate transporter-containing protein n=1 Tax=Strongyloides ratti TaxID=34506 RepID=A0A090KY24_STRRB|nr:Reduced folate carrier family and Major facilitator superfamily domain, general substrate transporter-containing protein [Strongyloides ratti]CEF60747.1 Reduced folate carrier family and Major facilitator superfamily domain, general substrate transporter-containing protein [Strongyloides ratti]